MVEPSAVLFNASGIGGIVTTIDYNRIYTEVFHEFSWRIAFMASVSFIAAWWLAVTYNLKSGRLGRWAKNETLSSLFDRTALGAIFILLISTGWLLEAALRGL